VTKSRWHDRQGVTRGVGRGDKLSCQGWLAPAGTVVAINMSGYQNDKQPNNISQILKTTLNYDY